VAIYLQGLQEEMANTKETGGKFTENSVQSAILKLQLKESRKTAEFLSSKWTDEDVQLLLARRLQFAQSGVAGDKGSTEVAAVEEECRAAVLDYAGSAEEGSGGGGGGLGAQRRKELLVECMSRDIFCVESGAEGREEGGEDNGMQVEALFNMLNKRYGMQEVDDMANKRQSE
jgi:hypothetical protein